MKLRYGLKQELKKTVVSYGFLLCTFMAFTLLFCCHVYFDNATGKTYSTIECMMKLSREQMKENMSFSSYNIAMQSKGGFFQMFLPIIASFPFIPNFCAERTSGLMRFTITRMGKYRYYIVKFISALLGGGLAVSLGYIFYVLVVYLFFPSYSSYNMVTENEWMMLIKAVIGMFFFGVVSTLPAFLFASFIKNKYLVTCIPFTLLYLYNIWLTKIETNAMVNYNDVLLNLENILSPKTITLFPYMVYKGNISYNIMWNYLLYFVLLIIGFIAFTVIMNRRWDCGE